MAKLTGGLENLFSTPEQPRAVTPIPVTVPEQPSAPAKPKTQKMKQKPKAELYRNLNVRISPIELYEDFALYCKIIEGRDMTKTIIDYMASCVAEHRDTIDAFKQRRK